MKEWIAIEDRKMNGVELSKAAYDFVRLGQV